MKKNLFLLAAAAVVMAGCSKTETVEMPDSAVIGFGSAYIGNPTQTKAVSTLTTANIDAFYVYGGHDNSLTNTFDGTKVTKSGSTWSYSPVRYWTAGESYNFAAYAPEIPAGKGTVSADEINGRLTFTDYVSGPDNQLDLIYADGVFITAQQENNGPVSFNFQHLLSMIKFTFKSGFPVDVPVTVSDLKVYGMAAQGTYDNGWTPDGTQAVAEDTPFNEMATTTAENKADASQATQAASANFVVIPQSGGTVTVSFTAAVSLEAGNVKTKEFTTTLVPAWDAGNCYNYVATISEQNMEVQSITYGDPNVTEWVEQEIESGIGTVVVVNTAGNLATLLANANPGQITGLRINGDLNEADFQYIRENLTALEVLDLSGTDMTVFPNRALRFDTPNMTITEVILPEGLTTIEDAAFANCSALEKLNVPSSVTTLGRWILENTQVTSFTIPDGVTDIPASCFYGTDITSIVIPANVTSIGAWAFEANDKLQSVVIEGNVTEIPQGCFIYISSLTSVTLPEGVTSIGADAFNQCKIASLTLPASLEVIGQRAFSNNGITQLTLPETIKEIQFSAFSYNNIATIDLPASIQKLASTAFHWESDALTTVICRATTVPEMPTSYTDELGTHTYSEFIRMKKDNVTLKVPAESIDAYKTAWGQYFKNIEAIN